MASSTVHGCTQCSFTTASLQAINVHVTTSNTEMKLWCCPGCGVHFCHATDLKSHFNPCRKFGTWRTTMKWGRDLDNNGRVQSACEVTKERAGATAGRTSSSQQASQAVATAPHPPTKTAPSKAAFSRRAPPKRAPPKKTYDNGQQQIGNRRKRASEEEEQSDDDPAAANEDKSPFNPPRTRQASPPSKRCRTTRNATPNPSTGGPDGNETSAANFMLASWPTGIGLLNETPNNVSPATVAEREALETAYANAELRDWMVGFGPGITLDDGSDESTFNSKEALERGGLTFEEWNERGEGQRG
ncbi:unnamed protein product [Zymoseptoria tritici ST99CH_3D7]|uniref:C2H2-type domain-containing protein n=1 Tax=Zymoseptoria tritici (strain ST99CH_3D7) TaxID=1276538 RepID=A0A1X7S0Q6_ZYMT9|nr:unnamed protein product [Zymoseptoria tritici ST99CH_3D7]